MQLRGSGRNFVRPVAPLASYPNPREHGDAAVNASKAIAILNNYPHPITNLDDLKNINGIGERILSKIKEFINTGHISQLNNIITVSNTSTADTSSDIYNDLLQIYGVGAVKANSLISEHHITSINQLRSIIISNPDVLNNKQKIGLKYYDDIKQRIPRTEMVKHESLIDKYIKTLPSLECQITGSFRRCSETSGDIDVLVTGNKTKFQDFLNLLINSKYITDVLAHGQTKLMGICRIPDETASLSSSSSSLYRRIDVIFTPKVNYPFALLYFTGSGEFNIEMRKLAMANGLLLNEKELSRDGHKITETFKTEEDIFKYLKIKYIDPCDRNANVIAKNLLNNK